MTLNPPKFLRLLVVVAALGLVAAACGDDDDTAVDPPAGAETDDPGDDAADEESEDADDSEEAEQITDAGYAYASDVSDHRLVSEDLCDINELLDAEAIDFAAVATVYRDGGNSVKGDGTVRTLAGFATAADKSPELTEYYGSDAPLDEFVTAALDGTGTFEGASDAERKQGIQKGVQNQIMIAWVHNELTAALGKAADGNFDVAEGAVHNWDEAWAFYAGAQPDCSPYATADKRAENFGTVAADGATSLTNEAILAAMIAGRDALVAEDAAGAEAAAAEVERQIAITYAQATIRYGAEVANDLGAGDAETAATHRAEGYAFWRVIEATAAANGADVDAINAAYAADGEGGEDLIRAALAPMLDALDITDAEIGTLS